MTCMCIQESRIKEGAEPGVMSLFSDIPERIIL